MRITCTATPRGNVYRIYKDDDNFRADLRPLIPLVLACEGDVLIGDEDDVHVALLVTAGAMRRDSEAEFLRKARRYLDASCPAEPLA